MRLPQLVDDLLLTISNAKVPNATRFDRRLLVQWINNQRALWLSNEYGKGREIMNNEIQTLNHVELELDMSSSISYNLPEGIAILKSKLPIPRTLQLQTRDAITAIRGQNRQSYRFNYVSRELAPHSGNGIFNSKMLFAFKIDDYIYIKFGKNNWRNNIPTDLMVEGVFENPLEVDDFNGTTDYIWDGINEYPMSMKFAEYVKNAILQTNFMSLLTAPADNSANDQHNIQTVTK